jgi:hypothetical protein
MFDDAMALSKKAAMLDDDYYEHKLKGWEKIFEGIASEPETPKDESMKTVLQTPNYLVIQGHDYETGKLTEKESLTFTQIASDKFTVHAKTPEGKKAVKAVDLLLEGEALVDLYNFLGQRIDAINHQTKFLEKYEFVTKKGK